MFKLLKLIIIYLLIVCLIFSDLPTRDLKVIGEPASTQRQKPESSFQSAMKVPIMIAQYFGLFPVIGISGTDASKLR